MKTKLQLRLCALAFLGSAILAFGLYNVHSFADITEGGVLGLSLLLEHCFALSPAVTSLALNALFYFLGWRTLGKEFIGYSIVAGVGFSLCYAIFESFPPLFPAIVESPLLSAIIGALFVGVGCGLAVRAGGAPSGDDAFAMSFSKIFKTSIWIAYFISDATVLLLSLSYIPAERILYSFITVLLSGQIVDFIGRIGKEKSSSRKGADERDVLVGTLRNRDQLTSALTNRFYHIPAIRVETKAIPPKYVAIYQSLHKFSDNPGILFYGEVEKYSLVKRREIKEIPRDSSEMYYRFDIKEWKSLPSAITPDCEDFTALFTSRFLLANARTTSELRFESNEKFRLYLEVEKLVSDGCKCLRFEEAKVELHVTDTCLVVVKNNCPFFTCSKDDYIKTPQVAFEHIAKAIL